MKGATLSPEEREFHETDRRALIMRLKALDKLLGTSSFSKRKKTK